MTDTEAKAALQEISVDGVRVAAVEAGVRYADCLDLVAIELAPGTEAAAIFTRNAFCAAPVTVAREHLQQCQSKPSLLLINTGNANAGTGQPGLEAARACCDAAAKAFGVHPGAVLPFSTGVIGEDLPTDKIVAALDELAGKLSATHWEEASVGILTTDTVPKLAARSFEHAGTSYQLTGMAKGAGMLRPNMATMLAFLVTDAPIAAPVLDSLLRDAAECSFHRISVDGDTSTNDAVVLAATGTAPGVQVENADDELALALATALESLCVELAQGLVRDGEGASKFVEVHVSGGKTSEECLDVAFTVAHSPLVKTALFAADPNWGRVLAAIGRAGIEDLAIEGVRLAINDELIAEHGARAESYSEEKVAAAMAQRDLVLSISLDRGDAEERVWTTDFSYDYVRINAEYRS